MNDDLSSSKAGRRVAVAVAVALLAHFGLYCFARGRSASAPDGGDKPETPAARPAVPAAVSVDLRRGSDVRQGQLALATDLRSATEQFQPVDSPVFDSPLPLPRDRLAFSAALGDGDRGRPGFHIDDLLTPVLREIAAVRRTRPAAPVRAVAATRAPRIEPPLQALEAEPQPAADDDALVAAQSRAAAVAAQQPVQVVRIPPRERLPPPPAVPEAAAVNDAAVEQFFAALTSQLMTANQRALADAFKAGPRATIEVRFVVDRDGRVSNAAPASPSGSPELDARAVRVVTEAAPLPPPPTGLPQSRLQLTFPVQVYR